MLVVNESTAGETPSCNSRTAASLFISYRRSTGSLHAQLLYERLAAHFGAPAIYFDRASIQGGERWREGIKSVLRRTVAVLAVVDPAWPRSFFERHEKQDLVKFELRSAVRLDKTIIPLLVGGIQKLPSAAEMPISLRKMLEYEWIVLHDNDVDDYGFGISRVIARLTELDGLIDFVESEVTALLVQRRYAEAESVLLRQSDAAHARSRFSAYLALATLAGRSFNSLHPNEREKIETLLRMARAAAPSWDLPALLLAVLEIDYYELHGLVSTDPVPASAVFMTRLDECTRALLTGIQISSRAIRELQIGWLRGAPND